MRKIGNAYKIVISEQERDGLGHLVVYGMIILKMILEK